MYFRLPHLSTAHLYSVFMSSDILTDAKHCKLYLAMPLNIFACMNAF